MLCPNFDTALNVSNNNPIESLIWFSFRYEAFRSFDIFCSCVGSELACNFPGYFYILTDSMFIEHEIKQAFQVFN